MIIYTIFKFIDTFIIRFKFTILSTLITIVPITINVL